MKFFVFCASALLACGCSIIDANGIHIGYSFDPQEFTESLGDPQHPMTLPEQGCVAGEPGDPCAALSTGVFPTGAGSVACDPNTSQCTATEAVTLRQMIDLRNAMTPLPDDVINFSVESVSVDRIAYWAAENTLNVPTPPIDIYVAAAAATDEHDPTAVKLGTVASLPAMSRQCADPPDTSDPAAQKGQPVCDLPLSASGQAALGGFIKKFKSMPFVIILRATVTIHGGEPVPAGALDLFVRPTVTFHIIK